MEGRRQSGGSQRPSPATAVRHVCLSEDRDGGPLEEAQLTDRSRVAVLLQGAALLSHLDHAGWSLDSFAAATVTDQGRLIVAQAAPGRGDKLAQQLLRQLTQRLFRSRGEVSGRGQARRLVRRLQGGWIQNVMARSSDRLVGEILERAPFLWQPGFASARVSLVSELRSNEQWNSWIAGPGFFRARLLLLAVKGAREGKRTKERAENAEAIASPKPSGQQLETVLRGALAGEAWKATVRAPRELIACARWSAAVRVWSVDKPETNGERRLLAESLYNVGRFEDSLAALPPPGAIAEDDIDQIKLRLQCLYQLSRLPAALHAVRKLDPEALDGEQLVLVGDVVLRILANRGDKEALRHWVRCLGAVRGKRRIAARLLAAQGCWDLGERTAMERHLAIAEPAANEPDRAWLYHQACSLLAIARGDGEGAVAEASRALAKSRRHLRSFEAGRLWNDLVLARVTADDLAGAERACRHSLRLLETCDGPARTTLGLYNFAELRIRRGRLDGVRTILEHSTRENRLAKNVRGAAQDAELWARFELARGRAADAVERCWQGLDSLVAEGIEWNRPELEVLQARALAFLGRGGQSRELLEELDDRSLRILEPEESAVLLAHAGLLDRAREAALRSRVGGLLSDCFDQQARESSWQQLEHLEPYRAARLVYDLELLNAGTVPDRLKLVASETLRECGALPLADRLDAGRRGPWQAVSDYLGQRHPNTESIAQLFESSGHPEASLWFANRIGVDAEPVVAGIGGEHQIEHEVDQGTWSLRTSRPSDVLEALVRLVAHTQKPVSPATVENRPSGVIGESPQLAKAWVRLRRLGAGTLPVLILGETGTGKEMAAREVHRSSARRDALFLAVNCAAISETLVLSDLFGHAQGAFTGADQDHRGFFEAARGGTVFLDEVGDLPATAQGMLLRVLQEGEIRRLGESHVRHVDVRIVAATHNDLERKVADGLFRQDLFYRLSVGRVQLPPLRDRGGDVLLLADHFLSQTAPGARLSQRARELLLRGEWPGNVRQLRGVVETAVALAEDPSTIRCEHLDLPPIESQAKAPYHEWLDDLKRKRLEEELLATDGNQAEAARRLGLSRQALSYLVRQFRLL